MAKKILCKCGTEMSIAKTYGAREDIDVLTQCSKCMLAGYEVGYTDGAATSAHKTTLEIGRASCRERV